MSAVLEAREPSARDLEVVQPALVQRFELLATAFGGVARLRRLILTLAAQGKLVSQSPSDEPAAAILDRARKKRAELLGKGEIRRAAVVAPATEGPTTFRLPAGWAWTCIGEVGQVVGGGTPKSDVPEYWAKSGVPWLTPADLYGYGKAVICRGRRDISPEGLASSSARILPAGTVLFSSRAPIGYVAIAGVPLATNQGFKSCVPYVDGASEYLYWQLRLLAPQIDAAASGTTFKEISGTDFSIVEFALPPLAEQARIVARIDELMRLCDALEANGRLGVEQHARLLDTLLGTLTDSSTPEELTANWQRVADHFDLLLDRPEAVDALEQTILQLAVRGLLVNRVPDDEPARVLLDRISAQRQRKQTKPPVGLAELAPGVAPYELPSHWEWAQLGDLVENMGSGWSPACEEGERTHPARWAVLRTTAVQVMEYRAHEHKAIPLKFAPRPEIEVQPGDILVTRAGPMNRVGISCWVGQTPARLMLSDKIVRFHPVSVDLSPAFVVLALNAGWTRELLEAAKTGMAASQVNVSQSDLKSLWVPICSTEEQTRIVARVTELRRLCADLRQRLDRSSKKQASLADALIKQALSA